MNLILRSFNLLEKIRRRNSRILLEKCRKVMHRGETEHLGDLCQRIAAVTQLGFRKLNSEGVDVVNKRLSVSRLEFAGQSSFVSVEEEAKLLYRYLLGKVFVDVILYLSDPCKACLLANETVSVGETVCKSQCLY